jgi:hypothetical protein
MGIRNILKGAFELGERVSQAGGSHDTSRRGQ